MIAAMVAFASCTQGSKPSQPMPGLTPENHTWFPITGASVHALGATAADGPIACESCHPANATSFKDINCVGCHEHAPLVTNPLHNSVTGYAYQSASCFSCHPSGAKVPFDHAGITDGCAVCHDVGAVYAALPVAGFTHPDTGGADCSACHQTDKWKGANGAPAQLVWDHSRDVTVAELIPTYAGTSIASLTPQTETLAMAMNHASADIASATLASCAACHVGAAAGAYFPGTLHSALSNLTSPQPTQCGSCHTVMPKGFVGPKATNPVRTPASGEMKHDAVAWVGGAPSSTAIVPADCGVCHAAPSSQSTSTWAAGRAGTSPALYHSSLASAGQGQPSSCVDCHANSRPSGILTSTGTSLPTGVTFDHDSAEALGDCAGCHAKSAMAPFASWSGGRYHLAGSTSPTTCQSCHAAQRPVNDTGWVSTTYKKSPFDYGTNVNNITHGDGQDCALCHTGPGTGAWGANPNWVGGNFKHGPTTISGTTCIACHASQRPDLQPGANPATVATLLGFDHANNGAGDCFACHQATVDAGTYVNYYKAGTASTLPGGDWKDGVPYPGSTFATSATQFVTVNETSLNRSGPNNLVTSTTTISATLYNGMLHTSSVVPTPLKAGPTGMPDNTTCWHCHTSTGTTVTSFNNGQFHKALTNFRSSPDAGVVAFPQPTTRCADCHSPGLPVNIVQKAGSTLIPMDHAAPFAAPTVIGGVTVTSAAQLDCSACHKLPGNTWSDGVFHANIGTASPKECVGCHYLLMADAAKSDVTSGTTFTMKHRSTQLTLQACETCHANTLAAPTVPALATKWKTGTLHPTVPMQPGACVECHAASLPPAGAPTRSTVTYTFALGGTATNGPQYQNHLSPAVVGKDCVVCHAADAKKTGSAWSKSAPLHAPVPVLASCKECHGVTNGGGSVIGTNNNLPLGLTNSTTLTSAGANTGIAPTTLAQLTHADVNVTAYDCKFCHTQLGPSTGAAMGKEWAQAVFHTKFTSSSALVMDGVQGRCSNCHMNERPGAAYPNQDHSTFTAVAGSQDCSSCHSWPGTGTAAAPNWHGASGTPPFISVGGFTISQPPATSVTTQAGIANLPHPSGTTCTQCHATSGGGKNAKGYDHASPLVSTNCNSCHEAGSNLVGTAWNGATTLAAGAGDTRPFTLGPIVAQFGNGLNVNAPKHFFPVDCLECHVIPSGTAVATTGATYAASWSFPHTTSKMTNPSTCLMCHINGIPGAPVGRVADPAASVSVAVQVPKYTSTSITSLTAQTQTLPMSMDHASTEFAAAANSSCANCHEGAINSVYFPGLLHSSLATLNLPAPTACASCHADAVPNGFVGPVAASPPRTPSSAEMKHDAVSWDGGVPTSTRLVTTNCGQCHISPSATVSASWAKGRDGGTPAKYHAAITVQPGSCVDCHANSRPNLVLTSVNAVLPANVTYDHTTVSAKGDCTNCHMKSAQAPWASWSGGKYHLAGAANPPTCLPCHAGERPTNDMGWVSTTYKNSPFDYGTNASGITHGDGLDCAVCHAGPGTGVWGSTQNWVGGVFTHGASTVSGSTCIACHRSQRPDLQPGFTAAQVATLLGFDHVTQGTGDCIGCHQATVIANTYVNYWKAGAPSTFGGDWKGGVEYPGSAFTSGGDQFITVNSTTLHKTGALVTSMSTQAATLYNGMVHTSPVLNGEGLYAGPTGAPITSTCWHCHTSTGTTATSYANGQYHSSLTNYRATPAGTVTPIPQPTTNCSDCHAQMLPVGIVMQAGSNLQPMDHAAQFTTAVTLGGQSVTAVSQADCSVCHKNAGGSWAGALFHANIAGATPRECVSCHYPLMVDVAKSDTSNGTHYKMSHQSTLLTFQACATCHPSALGAAATASHAATLWATGAYHPTASPQPTRCEDCHTVSNPPATPPTQSSWSYTLSLGVGTNNQGQWMSHSPTSVAALDCAACHAADAKTSGSAWSKATYFHPTSTSLCQNCHGVTNGGGTQLGTNNNLPVGLTNSTLVTSAGAGTGVPAGTLSQLTHADVNVTGHDCNFCHTQVGISSVTGVKGKEWAQAQFHAKFTGGASLVMNGTTGRCSNCHMNVRPTAVFAAQDHSTFTATSGTQDCSACHSWPGTGTASAPNWLGAAGMPQYIAVGGFTIPKPPAATLGTTQGGINNLPHPAVAQGVPCTTCHLTAAGGKKAFGYDHLSPLIASNCRSCHEAGSDLVGTVWNNATTLGAGAGDTRPFTATALTPTYKGNTCNMTDPNHFFGIDCKECHVVPTGNGLVTTGSAYVTAWRFPHTESKMTNPSTCNKCHGAPNNCVK